MRTPILALIPALLLAPACAPEDADDLEFRTTLGTGSGSGGGTVFNTNWAGDLALPELPGIGGEHRGIILKRVVLAGGEVMAGYTMVDGEIVAHDAEGNPYAGESLIASQWTLGGPATPHELPLLLASSQLVDGVPHYQFAHGGATLRVSTCKNIDGGDDAIHARLLTGFTLDEATGTIEPSKKATYLACTNGATGKAATWGYHDLAVALEDWAPLETAIRVIRADYCYDGESHTHPGVELQIEDRWGVLTQNDGGPIEAVWGAGGLLCRGTGRDGTIPATCGDKAVIPCPLGASFKSFPGARFITRLVAP